MDYFAEGDTPPELLPSFEAGLALRERIMAISRDLPILHRPSSNRIRYVLHFSEDVGISHFDKFHSLTWADVACASIDGIRDITSSFHPELYRALYILRVGLGDDETALSECRFFSEVQQNYRGGCNEYALANPVGPGQFGKLLITLNAAQTDFL